MEDVSVLSLLGRLVFSLAFVLVLMAVAARVLRNRTTPGLGRPGARRDVLHVVARQPLTRTASVAIVKAGDRALVIGVTDQRVEVLSELEPSTLEAEDDGAPVVNTPSWTGFLDALRERSVRRS